MFGRVLAAALVAGTVLLAPASAQRRSKLKLASVFGDHMVLQRGVKVPVWGKAGAEQWLAVRFRHDTYRTRADENGDWRVDIGPYEPGPPDDLWVTSAGVKRLKDVLVGDVWLCSGQSNMEWPVRLSNDAEREVPNAAHSQLRLFRVAHKPADEPMRQVEGSWQLCSPETIPDFSAVAYSFGRELQVSLDVPIGLIQSTWGGTPAEAWTSREGLAARDELGPILESWDAAAADFAKQLSAWEQASVAAQEKGDEPPPRPQREDRDQAASALYNGMIAPLVPAALRGVIWYQGESNASRAYEYRALFTALIEDWRRVLGAELPFYFVQLANFKTDDPASWAELREAQTMALALPHTGMAVTIDIGNPTDIHPRNKQEVGRRLALWALSDSYGKELVCSGPLFTWHEIEGASIRVHFTYAGGGLTTRGGAAPQGFEVASADGDFVPAEATIDGATIVVKSDAVPEPAHVRYAWTDNPENANVVNRERLPASPFRTDERR